MVGQAARFAGVVQVHDHQIRGHDGGVAAQVDERQPGDMGKPAVPGFVVLRALDECGDVGGAAGAVRYGPRSKTPSGW